MLIERHSETLVCVPCYNSESTIVEVLSAVLNHTKADVILIDDGSDRSLRHFIRKHFPNSMQRVTVLRQREKLYSGGSKNVGIRTAIKNGYRTLVAIDSDIVCNPGFFGRIEEYFRDNPHHVIVAGGILPHGNACQYADTLVNFSSYLPDQRQEVSWKDCLAGYAFALNVRVFQQNPCFFETRMGGDDVLFFRHVRHNFVADRFPLLNQATVIHKPPRRDLASALSAQRRYARAFFTHNDRRRALLFNKIPWLHLLTPRFWLMLLRLLVKRRYQDLLYLPLCWLLDATRAFQLVRLTLSGYRDDANTF